MPDWFENLSREYLPPPAGDPKQPWRIAYSLCFGGLPSFLWQIANGGLPPGGGLPAVFWRTAYSFWRLATTGQLGALPLVNRLIASTLRVADLNR